jgi:hypothetical protein
MTAGFFRRSNMLLKLGKIGKLVLEAVAQICAAEAAATSKPAGAMHEEHTGADGVTLGRP